MKKIIIQSCLVLSLMTQAQSVEGSSSGDRYRADQHRLTGDLQLYLNQILSGISATDITFANQELSYPVEYAPGKSMSLLTTCLVRVKYQFLGKTHIVGYDPKEDCTFAHTVEDGSTILNPTFLGTDLRAKFKAIYDSKVAGLVTPPQMSDSSPGVPDPGASSSQTPW